MACMCMLFSLKCNLIFAAPSEAFATVDTHLAMERKIKMN